MFEALPRHSTLRIFHWRRRFWRFCYLWICALAQKPTSDSELENLSEDIEEGPVKKRKLNCYSIDKKLEAIDYAKNHSIHDTARYFKVDRKRIRYWKSQEGACICRICSNKGPGALKLKLKTTWNSITS
jgi:hypothetical protein